MAKKKASRRKKVRGGSAKMPKTMTPKMMMPTKTMTPKMMG